MKRFRNVWRDIVDYIKWELSHDEPIVREFQEVCDKATKYELLEKHYPNILARLNAAVAKKEMK